MSADLSPDRDSFVAKLVAEGCFADRRQALDHAVDLLRDEAETVQSIREGLASMKNGEGLPLEQAINELRQKHRIPSDA